MIILIVMFVVFCMTQTKKYDNFVPQIFHTDTTTDFIKSHSEKKPGQNNNSTIYPHNDNGLKALSSAQSKAPIAYHADLFHDPVMSDVTYYDNDDDGRLGLDKCIEKCKNGSCVEYGVTGHAHCFPHKN
jgi:hypothetical protein